MLTPSTTDGVPPLFSVSVTLRYAPGFPPDKTCAAVAVPPLPDEDVVSVQSVLAKVLSETVTAAARVCHESSAALTQNSAVRSTAGRAFLAESIMATLFVRY